MATDHDIPRYGAHLENGGGIRYTAWAPDHHSVVAVINPVAAPESERRVELERSTLGFFTGVDADGQAGDLYKFSIDGNNPVPDIASRYQPEGAFGRSQVIDPADHEWKAGDWQRPAWNGQVVYELHIGTFTQEGTYTSAISRLPHLVELGVTAVEIMPLAQCAGERNWGYDGVYLYAPASYYGHPREFRALVDACHAHGLAVILDLVYNHLGPEGDHTDHYCTRFWYQGPDTHWGRTFNLHQEDCGPVRAYLLQNSRYWLEEFRIDGFRMDATHALVDESTPHLLTEVAELVHAAGGFLIAEDERNSAHVLDRHEEGGWDFDAVWADDFHHTIRVSQTRENHSYYGAFKGTAEEIVNTLSSGWLFCGQVYPFSQKSRGTPCHQFDPQRFVYCISNHDQVGNRAMGERVCDLISPEAYRALSLLLCLVPYTPMLFMGQEWAADTPFLFFTDLPGPVGENIAQGRKEEFFRTGIHTDPAFLERMPNPQDLSTFEKSKLDWEQVRQGKHQHVLELYKAGLKLRRELFGGVNPPRETWKPHVYGNAVTISYELPGRLVDVCYFLSANEAEPPPGAQVLLRSNDPQFLGTVDRNLPETVVFSRAV